MTEPTDETPAECNKEHHLLCLQCGTERTWLHVTPLMLCPECGDDRSVPAVLDNSLQVNISTQELRILTLWASNWAQHLYMMTADPEARAVKAVNTITDRLAIYTDIPLTMSQELADLLAKNDAHGQ